MKPNISIKVLGDYGHITIVNSDTGEELSYLHSAVIQDKHVIHEQEEITVVATFSIPNKKYNRKNICVKCKSEVECHQ